MEKGTFRYPANRFGGYLPNRISELSDTRFSSDAVIQGFNDFMTQCRHSSVIRIPASPLKRIRDEPICQCFTDADMYVTASVQEQENNSSTIKSNRTMSNEIFVAFATQKGGIGKSTVTALAASYLHNVQGHNVAVIDCDAPQHSIHGLRERETKLIDESLYFKALACDHFRKIRKNAYPVIASDALNALDDAERMLAEEEVKPDIVFFDMPGTLKSNGVVKTLSPTLGNFYEQPKNDNAEMDELLERIASLESELESEKGKASAMDDQVALMEKSYELAAKYMGGQNSGKPETVQAAEAYPVQKAGKNMAAPVRQVAHLVVSSLSQPMSNAEFVASFSQERNRSFNTAVGVTTVSDKNTISACVYGAQSVTDGQAVKLRLLEPMAVADKIIPRNTVVVGTAKIQGERLDIEITSLEYAGTIIPVELAVYDTDGQPGIFIPNSMEMNAVREVAANIGGSLGSSINISTNAGAQLASDLGKGLIQGTSQYIAKKMRTVKVHLKAGYKVMLYQDRD